MTATKHTCKDPCEHDSDCALHNAPALPIASCDCGPPTTADLRRQVFAFPFSSYMHFGESDADWLEGAMLWLLDNAESAEQELAINKREVVAVRAFADSLIRSRNGAAQDYDKGWNDALVKCGFDIEALLNGDAP